MTDKEFKELIESENVISYIALVKKYCDFIENRKKYSSEVFLKIGLFLLVNLYQKTLHLDIEYPEDEEDIEIKQIEHSEWAEIFNDLNEIIGDSNVYRSIFDPYEPESEQAVTGTLSDDFVDIYRDLKNALNKYSLNEKNAKLHALDDFIMNFTDHWGRHAVSAINTLHHCVISNI